MPRRLRPEEEALWRLVAAHTTPLHPAAPEPRPAPPARPVKPQPAPAPLSGPRAFRVGEAAQPADHRTAPARRAPLRLDRRVARDLSRGKRVPEASIDLHGMTLAQAHAALTRFVLASFGTGRRLVLVVTGKGKGAETDWHNAKGILRRQVPDWLTGPPLGTVVQEILPAHRSHGGDGAYYVVLRRG